MIKLQNVLEICNYIIHNNRTFPYFENKVKNLSNIIMMMMMMMMMMIVIIMIIRKIIKKMNKNEWIITCHFVLNVWMKLPVHLSILDNRFSELKKNLMANFKIWLLPLKETFVDALNSSDIHSNNLNFASSKRGWFFRNMNINSFPKEKIFPFGNNCWKGFAVWTDYVFQIKF